MQVRCREAEDEAVVQHVEGQSYRKRMQKAGLTTQERMASAAVLPASTFAAFFTTCMCRFNAQPAPFCGAAAGAKQGPSGEFGQGAARTAHPRHRCK